MSRSGIFGNYLMEKEVCPSDLKPHNLSSVCSRGFLPFHSPADDDVERLLLRLSLDGSLSLALEKGGAKEDEEEESGVEWSAVGGGRWGTVMGVKTRPAWKLNTFLSITHFLIAPFCLSWVGPLWLFVVRPTRTPACLPA